MNDNQNEELQNFITIITSIEKDLEYELLRYDRDIVLFNSITSYNNNGSINDIIRYKDRIIAKDSSLKDYLDIIEFFDSEGMSEVEQSKSAIRSLLNSELFNNIDTKLLDCKKAKKELNIKIGSLKKIIEGTYDFNDLLEALELSEIPEDDVLKILKHEAISSCKKDEIKEEESKIEEELTSIEDINAFNERYFSILDKSNTLINDNYSLIEKTKGKKLEYYTTFANIINMKNKSEMDEPIDILSMQNKKEIVVSLLISLIKKKSEVENSYKENGIDTEFNYEYISYELDELEEMLNICLETIDKIKEEDKEENKIQEGNIGYMYLLDDNGNPLFDLDSFNKEEKKTILSLLSKFDKGLHSFRTKSNARVQTSANINEIIYRNRQGNISIGYVFLNQETSLVLSIYSSDDIYEETPRICSQYQDTISKMREMLKKDNNFIRTQDEIKSNILEELIPQDERTIK